MWNGANITQVITFPQRRHPNVCNSGDARNAGNRRRPRILGVRAIRGIILGAPADIESKGARHERANAYAPDTATAGRASALRYLRRGNARADRLQHGPTFAGQWACRNTSEPD